MYCCRQRDLSVTDFHRLSNGICQYMSSKVFILSLPSLYSPSSPEFPSGLPSFFLPDCWIPPDTKLTGSEKLALPSFPFPPGTFLSTLRPFPRRRDRDVCGDISSLSLSSAQIPVNQDIDSKFQYGVLCTALSSDITYHKFADVSLGWRAVYLD